MSRIFWWLPVSVEKTYNNFGVFQSKFSLKA